MRLFHSSPISVEHPDTAHSRNYLDFGKGFYLTSIKEQAIHYAQRLLRRGKTAWLNTYELDASQADWKVLRFDKYNQHWLQFVSVCRAGEDQSDYDMVVGGIADDKVVQTLDRYFNGEITEEQALGLLKYERPNIQYCIRSDRMLNECLTFIESQQL